MDFRKSDRGRAQAWHGLKEPVKKFLSLRIPHAGVRLAAQWLPAGKRGRLPAPANVREVKGRVGDRSFVMLDPARCVVAKERIREREDERDLMTILL